VRDADVIVIGAGLSGLVCATRLVAGGARVRVLEARDRVGGRLLGREVGGAAFDLGGQWWTRGQTRLAELADELGIARVPQFRSGESVLSLERDAKPRSLPDRIFDVLARGRRLAALSRMIARAGEAPDPAWDRESLGDYLARALPDPVLRDSVAIHCEMTFAADPRELSLLDYLAQLAATTDPFDGTPGDEHRLLPGAFALPARLAESLGDRVTLSTPVHSIDLDAGIVTTPAATLQCDHIVLALPPRAARTIAFVPALPPPLTAAITASRPGPVVKCVATYDRAFWRDDGHSGESYLKPGLVRATADATVDVPALSVFVVAADASTWSRAPESERRAQVLADLARLFGDRAASPTAFAFHDWGSDPWSGGCVAGLPPGARSGGAAWRGVIGRLHIAGTEAAEHWPGFMDGAIESAERMAARILGI
jgi:monoamine oxidase